jgi:WXG100 family type VII secretion target
MANVNVTFQDMEAAASGLHTGRESVEAVLAGLQRRIEELVSTGYVTDSSSGAFFESYQVFNTGCLQAVQGLTGMAGYLNAAAGTFRDADLQLASAARR